MKIALKASEKAAGDVFGRPVRSRKIEKKAKIFSTRRAEKRLA